MIFSHALNVTWPLLYNPECSVLVGVPNPVQGLAARVNDERPAAEDHKAF